MSDQQLVGIDRIVAALNRVNASIQKTQTYKDANKIDLVSRGGTAIISGASATLAFLGVMTLVPGTTAATSGADGVLSVGTGLVGSVDGVGAVIAEIDNLIVLAGTIDNVSDNSGEIDKSIKLIGSLTAESGGEAAMQRTIRRLVGDADGEAVVDASLSVVTQLIASVSAVGQCGGNVEGIA